MNVGTVTSKFVADAGSYLKTMAQVTSAHVRQSETLKKTGRSVVELGHSLNSTITGYRMFQEVVNNATEGIARNSRMMISHRMAVRQYNAEMRNAAQAQGQFATEASRMGNVSQQLFNLAAASAAIGAVTVGIGKLKALAHESMLAAAEVQTLDKVMTVMGDNAGYSIGFLRDQVNELRTSGIEAAASARGITDFLKTGLPLNRIKELSRLAQDLAVIGGTNSTESFQRVLWGITTGQTDVLRVAGLNVSFETAYAKLAAGLGRSVTSLTEAEKLHARLNEVMKQAPSVAGAYDAAMDTAGKQLSSMPRLINDVKVALGNTLLPVFKEAIFATNDWLKSLRALIEEGPLGDWIARQAKLVAKAFEGVSKSISGLLEGTNITPFLAGIEKLVSKLSSLGRVGGAGLAGMFSSLLSQLPMIGRFLAPFTGWQVAVIAFIASSAKMRAGIMDIATAIFYAAQRIGDALLPAMQEVASMVNTNGSSFERLASLIARQIDVYSRLVVILISGLRPAIQAVTFAFKALYTVISLNPVVMFVTWIGKLIAGTEGGRFAMLSLVAAIKTFSTVLISGLKTAALLAAFDGINRSVSFLRGNIDAFNGFLSQSVGRMKTAALMAGVYSVAVLGITFALQKMAAYQADAAERFDTMFDNAMQAGGIEETVRMANVQLDAMAAEIKHVNNETLLFEGSTNKLVQAFDLLSSAVPGGQAAKNVLQWENLMPWNQINQGMDRWKSEVDLGALRGALNGILDELKVGWKNMGESIRSDTATVVEELESSRQSITRAVGNFGVEAGTFDRLTPGMTKAMDEAIAQINQETDQWARSWTSIGEAMLDKEVEGWDDLMAFYDRQLVRTAAFFQGLDLLKGMGAPDTLISEMLKGGPDKFGAAMQDLLVKSAEMGPEATQAMVKTLGQQKLMQDQMIQFSKEKYAAMTLHSEEYKKQLADEAAVQDKRIAELKTKQLQGVDEIKRAYSLIGTAFRASDVSDTDRAVMDNLIGRLNSQMDAARTAIQNGMKVDAAGITQTVGDIMSLLPEHLQSSGLAAMGALNSIVASNGELVGISANLGKQAGIALSVEMAGVLSRMMSSMGNRLIAQGGWSAQFGKALLGGAQGAMRGVRAQLEAEAADAAARTAALAGSGPLYPQAPDPAIQKAADDAAEAAERQRKAIEDVYKNNTPLKLFGEAMEQVWGKSMRFVAGMHASADAADSLADTITKLASGTDSQSKKQRVLDAAVMSAVKAIREEVEAMADLGLIGNSVEAMTAATSGKIEELKNNLPGLVNGFNDVTKAAETVSETLSRVHDAIDQTLGKFLSAEEATYNVEEQIDRLSQAYLDQIDLLTNTALEGKDVRDIKRATNKELIAAVRAIQAEAKALAENGEIGADAASQTEYLRQRLAELGVKFPELKTHIEGYTRSLAQVPENVQTRAHLDVAAAQAMLEGWRWQLAQIPPAASTLLQIRLDEASMGAMYHAHAVAADFNGLRMWELGTERAISGAMWDQVLALESQRITRSNAGGWIGNMANGIIGWVQATIANIRGSLFDSGGVLQPGLTMAWNKTNRDEYVFTADQVRALHGMGMMQGAMGGGDMGPGSVTIERLELTSNEPPRAWFNEALWRAARGFGQTPALASSGQGI